jgi:2,4-dienoyl-CoA reductase-like NADH-dependent reductase (Old Yellow Enzyme family)
MPELAEPLLDRRAPHGAPSDAEHDLELPEIDLLSPLDVRAVSFRNRIAVSPMCQYSAEEGFANNWHLVHLGSRAVGGAGLVMVEATAVTRNGRITPCDLGLWRDDQVQPLANIVEFIHEQGATAGIQLGHAGRKASCEAPWEGGGYLWPESGGWKLVAPSSIPFSEDAPVPEALDEAGIDGIVDCFEAAARRAIEAGFRVIEVHAAHGYLLHQFLSPLSNRRDDRYGGPLENRMRLLVRIVNRLRGFMPEEMPLFVRISATDWDERGWNIRESVALAKRLKEEAVDLIDVSSGGTLPRARIPVAKGYQVPYARCIRDEANIMTAAVGLIGEPRHADEIVTGGDADLVFLARELLRDPYWPLKAQHELGGEPAWPTQYGYAVKRRAK